ncbi:unannotated protein [freshwater metagenome]|uniref:Unannotated protein n=1 Tax=freshwater metagenome TaxID=449393 RepID=A0A6J7RSC1_9ZZZZ
MIDCLVCLRLRTIICSDDDHSDVCDLGAAGTHCRERFVAGSVKESDQTAVMVHLVGTDVLRDTASLACNYLGLANRVEQ